MKSSIALLLSVLFLAGCSTDLEVNAPYKNITVVYGLLDKDKTRQYIKINKAFLGDGDALVYALIPDSNEYRPGEITEAYVEDLDNGTQYPLQDTLIENRITGTFYSPQQTVHYFDANDLDPDHLYRLFVRAKGEVITAETPVVDDLLYVSGFLNVNGPSKLNLKQGANYTTPEVRVTSGKHARRYDLYYRIIWDEETANGTTEKSLRRLIGTARTDGLNGNEGIDIAFNGESFFETIG
ncbi:MAG: DUF4249 family protein, partial [Flavobacteriales bacterium]|nr:DUF4249 family protein [Flavobacteriales bacterium]